MADVENLNIVMMLSVLLATGTCYMGKTLIFQCSAVPDILTCWAVGSISDMHKIKLKFLSYRNFGSCASISSQLIQWTITMI